MLCTQRHSCIRTWVLNFNSGYKVHILEMKFHIWNESNYVRLLKWKLPINIGTVKVRYRKYFEYSCTLNPDTLVPISYTDACTISRWPSDIKIGCDGDDGGSDGGGVNHLEAFAFAIFAMIACLSTGFRRSQVVSTVRCMHARLCSLLVPSLDLPILTP